MSNINKSIIHKLDYYKGLMDKDLKYSDNRLTLLNDMRDDPVIINYLSSPLHRNKQVKTKRNFQCESEPISKILEEIAYYLLFPDFENEQHEHYFKNDSTGTLLNNSGENNVPSDDYSEGINKKIHGYTINSKSKFVKDKSREFLALDILRKYANSNNTSVDDIDEDHASSLLKEQMSKITEKKSGKEFGMYYQVTKEDLEKFEEIAEMNKYLENLKERLGFGLDSEEKNKKIAILYNEFNHKSSKFISYDYEYDKSQSELTEHELKYKELSLKKSQIIASKVENLDYKLEEIDIEIQQIKQRPTDDYNMIFNDVYSISLPQHIQVGLGRSRIDFNKHRQLWNENKYVQTMIRANKEITGEMVLVKDRLIQTIRFKKIAGNSTVYDYDYSNFSFSDYTHVSALLQNHYELSDRHSTEFNDLWATMDELHEYINKTEFSKEEALILHCLFSGDDIQEIARMMTEYDEQKVRRTIDTYIPKKIVNTYKESRDEFVFYRYYDLLKPKYKKCSCCGEYKLVLKRYFSPDKRNKDGLRGICKKCDNSTKK